MKKERRFFDYILIGTFLLNILLPLILTRMQEISTTEKRALAPLPQLTWDKQNWRTFPQQFQMYFNDHFGFRDNLAQVYYWLGMTLKSSASPNVIVGKNQWLFYIAANDGNNLEDYRKNDPLTPEELARWKHTLEAKHTYLKQHGIPYLFVIAPNKHSIYGEYYSTRFQSVGNHSRLEQLLDYMQDSEVAILDLRQPLLQAKTDGQVFFKTNTHWNNFGAAIGQYEIMQYFAQHDTTIQPIKYRAEDFTWDSQHIGDLAIMLNLSNIIKDYTVPELRVSIPPCARQNIEEYSTPPLILTFITTCPATGPSALIFRDSFFDAMKPYASQYFSQSIYTHIQPDVDILTQFVEQYAPTLVIEERVERNLEKVP